VAAYVSWNECYSVGDPLLDAEHREIIDSINRLYLPLQGITPGLAAERLLDGLIRFTRTHFDHEEERLKETAFADFQAHKALHDDMMRRLVDLRARMTLLTSCELLGFLRDWWLTHIQEEDKKYVTSLERVRVWDSNLLRR
jgi:hemerythrin-like metal-binding protein